MALVRRSVTKGTLPTTIGKGCKLIHCSGRKIIEILKKNPKKDPSKYDEEDIQHMRKVAAYCKRHLAQEGKAKQNPESKSAKSLKNWVSLNAVM